jgi:hypothetical protein
MKTSRIIQFVVAAVLFSIGCVALLAHTLFVLSNLCFVLPGLILMPRSELSRPVPRRELFGVFVALLILAAVILCLKLLIPNSVGERIVCHPAFVIPLWILMMSSLIWRWRKERRLADA